MLSKELIISLGFKMRRAKVIAGFIGMILGFLLMLTICTGFSYVLVQELLCYKGKWISAVIIGLGAWLGAVATFGMLVEVISAGKHLKGKLNGTCTHSGPINGRCS